MYMCVCVCVCSVMSDSLRRQDCSPPGSSVHGIIQVNKLGHHSFIQGIFPAQGWNLRLLHCR